MYFCLGSCRIWADYLVVEYNISPVSVEGLDMTQDEVCNLLRGNVGYLYLLSNPSRFSKNLDLGTNTWDISWTETGPIRTMAAAEGAIQ